MSYCHNCGTQINENNVFCTSCGTKQVNESGEENKQSEGGNNLGNSNFNDTQIKITNSINNFKQELHSSNLVDVFVKMLIKPVLGGKQFIQNCEKSSVIAVTVLLTVVQGFLGMWKVNQFISTLQSTVVAALKQIAGIVSLFSPGAASSFNSTRELTEVMNQIDTFRKLLNIPYGKIFIQNAVIFLIGIAVLFIVTILAINVLHHRKSSPFEIFKTALIVSVPIIYFEAFSILASYISIYFGIGVFLIGIIISISSLSIILKEQLHIDENASTFITAVSFVLILISISICLEKFIASNVMDVINSSTNILKNLMQ